MSFECVMNGCILNVNYKLVHVEYICMYMYIYIYICLNAFWMYCEVCWGYDESVSNEYWIPCVLSLCFAILFMDVECILNRTECNLMSCEFVLSVLWMYLQCVLRIWWLNFECSLGAYTISWWYFWILLVSTAILPVWQCDATHSIMYLFWLWWLSFVLYLFG